LSANLFEDARKLADECGFTGVADLDVDTIRLRSEVREACEKCNGYGLNWSCPPGCGTIDENSEKIHKYAKGLILQTMGELEDKMDFEGMMELAKAHGEHCDEFYSKIRALYPEGMFIGTGGCHICEKCTYPDKPCRFPDRMTSSMESLGMLVSDVCKDNDLPYYYGEGTLAYVSCVLLEKH
jgi:predicted metal-binding protein